METVKVKDVEKNASGWYEITLEDDDRTVSTKNQKLADAAFAGRGTPVEVEINERQNGSFTNRYLNKIGDLTDERSSNGGGKAGSRPRTGGGGKSPEDQKRIMKQWALGRAVELLAASDVDIAFPLTDEQFADLKTTADKLYESVTK
jgi:hypothetical protein